MTIIRAPRPNRDFMVVRNGLVRDSRLSYRARGLLVAILSRPDDWRTTSEQLAREGKEGRDAIRACLRELEDAGYVVSKKVANERGQWSTEREVFDEPRVCPGHTEDGFPVVGCPTTGSPAFGFPDVGAPGAVLKNETEDRDENTLGQPPVDRFDEWWSLYPRKVQKLAAAKAWKRAVKLASAESIIAAVSVFAFSADRQFVPYPATWLNAGSWLDVLEPDPAPSPTSEPEWCRDCGWDPTEDGRPHNYVHAEWRSIFGKVDA